MIEQGLVQFIQGSPLVAAVSPVGGFLSQLPKDQLASGQPSWSYLAVSKTSNATLNTVRGFGMLRFQIDCYGTAPQVINLAHAIDLVMQGFRGVLPDPDTTYVDSCLQSDSQDFPMDEVGRNYRRMLEYEIWYSDGDGSRELMTTTDITVGASPFTYTAANKFEYIYISGGTITSLTRNGTPITGAFPLTVILPPGESLVLTYDEAPLMVRNT